MPCWTFVRLRDRRRCRHAGLFHLKAALLVTSWREAQVRSRVNANQVEARCRHPFTYAVDTQAPAQAQQLRPLRRFALLVTTPPVQ